MSGPIENIKCMLNFAFEPSIFFYFYEVSLFCIKKYKQCQERMRIINMFSTLANSY